MAQEQLLDFDDLLHHCLALIKNNPKVGCGADGLVVPCLNQVHVKGDSLTRYCVTLWSVCFSGGLRSSLLDFKFGSGAATCCYMS
jgi:hypothetical protein